MRSVEENKLIAEFMGAKVKNCSGISIIEFPDKSTCNLSDLKYHLSWDWLMPVIEKVESIGSTVEIHGTRNVFEKINLHSCRLHHSVFNTVTDKYAVDEVVLFKYNTKFNISKINCVYEAIVEFIKWYNRS